jgi:signal transduction histidine kinase
VSLLRDKGANVLVIEDDGNGFEDEASSPGQGLGNLRDRATRLGGSLSITTGADGTRVEMTLPA